MTKFRPGPWIYYIPVGRTHDKEYFISRKGSLAHADVYGKANARLIAAAPDMYEALKMIIEPYKATDEMLQEGMICNLTHEQQLGILKARQALAKADGKE